MKRELLGVGIDNLTKEEFLKQISSLVKSGSFGNYIVRPNAETITAAQADLELKTILNKANLAIPDGVLVLNASRLLNLGLKGRFGGPESMADVLSLSEENSFSVYLLGGKVHTVAKAAREIQKQFKKLNLVGFHDGYFEDSAEVVSEINNLKPNVVFVGMGFPRQEKWIWENHDKLKVNLLISEGGSLDYFSKEARRAPVFIRNVGLDWLFRLINQPWRIKRQLSLIKFLLLVLRLKL